MKVFLIKYWIPGLLLAASAYYYIDYLGYTNAVVILEDQFYEAHKNEIQEYIKKIELLSIENDKKAEYLNYSMKNDMSNLEILQTSGVVAGKDIAALREEIFDDHTKKMKANINWYQSELDKINCPKFFTPEDINLEMKQSKNIALISLVMSFILFAFIFIKNISKN